MEARTNQAIETITTPQYGCLTLNNAFVVITPKMGSRPPLLTQY